jgi:hypothetical protein
MASSEDKKKRLEHSPGMIAVYVICGLIGLYLLYRLLIWGYNKWLTAKVNPIYRERQALNVEMVQSNPRVPTVYKKLLK